MTSNCCAACGRPLRKAKPAPEWQRQHDLKRYEAAMKEKREHERKYGPIRPKLKLVSKN
jgi:hypothetical protein